MLGLVLLMKEGFKLDPHAGNVFVFKERRGDLIKITWYDGFGPSLYAKRLDRGRFRIIDFLPVVIIGKLNLKQRFARSPVELHAETTSQGGGNVQHVDLTKIAP